MSAKPTSGSWVKDAEALLEMGAGSIDANTVRGLLDVIASLKGLPDKPMAEKVLLLDSEPVANAIFGDDRSPMQWHDDVAQDVLKVVAGLLAKEPPATPFLILPLDPHPLEDSGTLYTDKLDFLDDGDDGCRRLPIPDVPDGPSVPFPEDD